ncbi:hypothetical protein [Planctomonas psychrotolerans]|uniref:hypothetical protein n=1 Tax=Planctomonas psychrotolerans TaxID=2528712 RepID=UPI00123C6E70|nr:hypothetical protein [Planctomonas psychrotolerans]
MKKPSARIRTVLGLSAAPVAILLAGGMVWQASSAAFTATTRNAGNSWSTGSVTLTDDDRGVAAYSVTNLVPGQTGTKCLVVTSTATVPGEVRSYVTNLAPSAIGLAERITYKLEAGTGGSFNDCTGFVPDAGVQETAYPVSVVAAARHDYASGGHSWITTGKAGGESRSYRGTWTFDTTGMTQQQIDALQGSSMTADLVWEFRNTTPAQ